MPASAGLLPGRSPMTEPAGLRFIGAAEVVAAVSLDAAVESQRDAFLGLVTGSAQLGERVLLPDAGSGSVVFSYAARLSPDDPPVCKFGAVVPANADRSLPTVNAAVLALDPVTGRPIAVIDGEAVTTLRTVAASMLAVDVLANRPLGRVGILGSGVQARAHALALAERYRPDRISLWSPRPANAGRAAAELTERTGVPTSAAPTAAEAVRGHDLILTCTTAREPILRGSWVGPGATVLSIGSFAPDRCEVSTDLLGLAVVVVDHRPTALIQAGPIVAGLCQSVIRSDEVRDLGHVLAGRASGRGRPDDIVFYNSVGVGVQDAALVATLFRSGVLTRDSSS